MNFLGQTMKNTMIKEGQELVAELNLTIKDLSEKNNCISRQRDSVIDQADILKNERDALITRNRELSNQLRKVQEELDKYKQPESLEDAVTSEMNKYSHVFMMN
tara:strand:- start:625 stop:936 length:312 start_codon:yes stop_codon:yes gene_type:complete